MPLIQAQDREYLINEFSQLSQPVKLIFFTSKQSCEYCTEIRQILTEVAELSASLSLEEYDVEQAPALAAEYRIDKTPSIVIMRGGEAPKDYGIRYFGIPSGYEFSSLIHSILMVGKGESGLSAASKAWAATLSTPIHIQVFVTPSCPYCPQAVLLAHRFALESDLIRADMIEAMEFPELAEQYQVMGVPRTVINERVHIEGAAPEAVLQAKLKEAVA
ncbi:MAG: glutaredoxin [Candidatus Thermofonsia Clade 1 bacterium]|jgi:glutaredoxin-like protein|uniref:Glutaredoxin n=1 Tax=Candidatus Thermofonsia Clade 1 bacterium TaxID=2364210 RepID=A0A2M8PFM0_9CHLR|nr:MAG: glutaredoxin [Candidatus Thermofonsia Clade 1 bacterium]RMF53033.1 MAG: glutaredoxin [Chloroflexota bacterium]